MYWVLTHHTSRPFHELPIQCLTTHLTSLLEYQTKPVQNWIIDLSPANILHLFNDSSIHPVVHQVPGSHAGQVCSLKGMAPPIVLSQHCAPATLGFLQILKYFMSLVLRSLHCLLFLQPGMLLKLPTSKLIITNPSISNWMSLPQRSCFWTSNQSKAHLCFLIQPIHFLQICDWVFWGVVIYLVSVSLQSHDWVLPTLVFGCWKRVLRAIQILRS